MICEYCRHRLRKKSNKFNHINIMQPLRKHIFCSEFCKNKWCFQIQTRKYGIIVLWALGKFKGRYFFIKNNVKTCNPTLIGAKTSNSYFISNLTQIETLELKEIDSHRFLKLYH